MALRSCLRDPIPEIFEVARLLSEAVSKHLDGDFRGAETLIRAADMPVVRAWVESLWGAGGPWTRPLTVSNPLPYVPKEQRFGRRMPSTSEIAALIERDGRHCRFCGIPVSRAEVRWAIHKRYPEALPWGSRNSDQHAGFQALWMQFDHLVPHGRGGTSDIENMIVTCAPCNNGRSNLTLEEAGLSDPRLREPVASSWDGLERFR